jgi:hypothetical protein
MSVRIWGSFTEFMTQDEAQRLYDAGLVTVTMLEEICDVDAVAKRTGLDVDWLQQKRHDARNRP